jgi:hypothetical protein
MAMRTITNGIVTECAGSVKLTLLKSYLFFIQPLLMWETPCVIITHVIKYIREILG